jgi:nitric oxide reductase NorD protein
MQAEIPDVARLDPSERGIIYDEWDWRAQRYKVGWCTVYPTPTRAQDPAWTRAALARQRRTIEALRDKLLIHRSRLQEAPRQRQGDDVDLDALVEALALRRAGHEDPRVYLQRQRRRRDVATTVLLDTSLSTDSWVQGRRVLDVAREAALALGEVAYSLGDRLQILAFASHTRNICRVWEVCGWSDPWMTARHKLGALKPQGYTRIGPALRHASSRLAKAPAQRRLLLLISDGKPTDYDRYEGRYGLADVRMALREARQAGVCVHALAVEATARASLPEAFGAGAWHVLPRPELLPQALTEAYGRLTL